MADGFFARIMAATAPARARAVSALDRGARPLSIAIDPHLLAALSDAGYSDLASRIETYWIEARQDRRSAFRADPSAAAEIDQRVADIGSRFARSDPRRGYAGFLFAIESIGLFGGADPQPLDAPLPILLSRIVDRAAATPDDADLVEAYAFSVLDVSARLSRSLAVLAVDAAQGPRVSRRRARVA